MRILIQHPQTLPADTIGASLKSRLHRLPCHSTHAAVAYATVSGARSLLDALPPGGRRTSQWLLGLDDCLTQPGAIEMPIRLPHAEVRVATLAAISSRFHPKVFHFRSVAGPDLFVIGSANLTGKALAGNSEAVVFLEAESTQDKGLLREVWSKLWAQGHKPTARELADYARRYEEVRRLRERAQRVARKAASPPRRRKEILAGDEAELDPAQATTCWIECGFVTAMGRELELKAEQGLFFGLAPTGGRGETFRFLASDGTVTDLRMKYQENHMWRLQMNNTVPEVRQGLRPRKRDGTLGRSPYVAVVTRTSEADLFGLRFVHLQSKAFRRLESKSRRLRTLGHTSARSYGWC